MAELNEGTVESSIREIEEATANTTAQARLSELKAELGLEEVQSLDAGPTPQPGPSSG